MINHKYPSSSFNGNHGNQWRAGNKFPKDKERQLPAIITPVMGTHLAERKPVFYIKKKTSLTSRKHHYSFCENSITH